MRTKVQRERLRKWAKALRSLKPTKTRKFDMNDWFYNLYNVKGKTVGLGDINDEINENLKPCGFAACAVGWLPTFFPRAFPGPKDYYANAISNDNSKVMGYFGLEEHEFFNIVYSDQYSNPNSIKPKQVAERIEMILSNDGNT